jgi:hypothetical protein
MLNPLRAHAPSKIKANTKPLSSESGESDNPFSWAECAAQGKMFGA